MRQNDSTDAAGSWTLDSMVLSMVRGDDVPGFGRPYFIKDLCSALRELERAGLSLPEGCISSYRVPLMDRATHGRRCMRLNKRRIVNQARVPD